MNEIFFSSCFPCFLFPLSPLNISNTFNLYLHFRVSTPTDFDRCLDMLEKNCQFYRESKNALMVF